ncbi:MAG: hypothetical protein OXH78_10055 [Acidimicrobiaceae bacterium]|nr:hypothetical protein [Acidimicrobiaceae bacterium]
MPDTMPAEPTNPTSEALREAVASVMEAAWAPLGYTAPNPVTYPWMWLWDSCFHSLIWQALGDDERAVVELESALSTIDGNGFVPHMGYQLDPRRSVELWGRSGASSITQPPMYGHAIAELCRAGVEVRDELLDRAVRGLRFFLDRRVRHAESGLIEVVHPWETGCDDSPRWDDLAGPGTFDLKRWRELKNSLLASVERGSAGEPLANPDCAVAPCGFNALVAFNAEELATVTADRDLEIGASELSAALDRRFDAESRTWVDAGALSSGSGRARTAEGLLPLLVSRSDVACRRVLEELADPKAYCGSYGPRGVHAEEPAYDSTAYWRGPVWPQLSYLLWLAVRRVSGEGSSVAGVLGASTVRGAAISGFAEYWDGDSGDGLGAIPQSWTGLALLLDRGP